MIILSIRTDKPEAEIGLYENAQQIGYKQWQAHRQLAETLHLEIKKLLGKERKSLNELEAIIVYSGPGSFTGLRIGISVANALGYALHIPIAGTGTENWVESGQQLLREAKKLPATPVVPQYGTPVHITTPRR